MLSSARLALAIAVAFVALACGDGVDGTKATKQSKSATTIFGGGSAPPTAPEPTPANESPETNPGSEPVSRVASEPRAATSIEPSVSRVASDQRAATSIEPLLSRVASDQRAATSIKLAPAAAVVGSPIFTRTVGTTTYRFWSTFEARTGRNRFEYHFHVTVQNAGSGLLRGAVMVTSSAAASRVVVSCAPFGTTPPGTTRDADAPFVISQDRATPFDATTLAFSIDDTPDPVLCDEPGRVTMRRLNRTDYDNTVRDLLGTDQQPALDFPADDFGYGFDNIGDVLALSPLLFEKAEAAARTLVEDALRIYPPAVAQRVQAETFDHECGASGGNYWNLYSECGISTQITVDSPSDYEIRVRAYASQAGPEIARMQIHVGGAAIGGEIEVPATSSAPATYTATTFLQAGTYTLRVEFTNDYYAAPADRNLYIDWAELYGPLDAPPPSPQIAAMRALCEPVSGSVQSCLRQRIEHFVRRAWRRPPTASEVQSLFDIGYPMLVDGRSFDESVGAAMTAAMTSPYFLFRVEHDPHARSAEIHPLTSHELATRLSYFLWSSMPDAELDALADAETLDQPATLAAQVHRMILDPKARGFVDSFGGQWLGTRGLDDVNPDYAYFPTWDAELKEAMREETLLYFQEFLQTQTDFLGFFDAKFSYVNDRLAQHYGIAAPGSTTPVRVALADGSHRAGIFTHGSVLTAYSQPRRTSPVKRGKWALDQVLCIEIQPPPAGVEGMLDTPGATGTLRERLAAHRALPECATCHDYLDPIGLGLENYDAIGAYRTTDAGEPIDASGQFPDGRTFTGAESMAALVKADPNTPHCVAERTLTYALGRGLEDGDDAHLDAITTSFESNGRSFERLLVAIVQSEPFRMRRGEPSEESVP
jgi:hypothetical protein